MGEILEFFSVYWVRIIIAVLGAYLMSSVNTSIIVTKIVLHKDIRTLGSGNAGFTNVLRCVGKVPAIITFVGDFLKGVISVAIAYFIMWGEPEPQKYYLMCTAGLFAVVGHTMPIYYKFKGGKGVVTTAAVMIMTDWRVLIVALLIFAVVFTATKIISVCALFNATVYPITTFVLRFLDYNGIMGAVTPFQNPTMPFVWYSSVMALITGVLVIVRHKDNIKRLLKGEEKKITDKKK